MKIMNVSLPSFEEQKNEVELSLARTIVTHLEQQKIAFEESQAIAQYILDGMHTATTPAQLLSFMQTLSAKWPMFESVAGLYRLKVKDELQTEDELQETKAALQALGGTA